MFVVLACSRSGTKYAAKFYRRLGFDFNHEKIGEDGGVGWNVSLPGCVADDDFDVVLHQVRNPVNVIQSLPTHNKCMWGVLSRHLGPFHKEKLIRCVQYWVAMNRNCEARAQMTYRVEDLKKGTETVKRLSGLLGFDSNAVPEMGTRVNSRRNRKRQYIKLRFSRVREFSGELYDELCDMMCRYGYGGDVPK